MTLRLDEAETEALRTAAEAEGVSMQELARKAIREYTDSWSSVRDSYLKAWTERNADLLRRLSE